MNPKVDWFFNKATQWQEEVWEIENDPAWIAGLPKN